MHTLPPILASVLIIDATPAACEALEYILRQDGFRISALVKGRERALAEIRLNQPDIICAELIDLDKSEMSLLAALHRDFPTIPVVVISNNADRHAVQHAIGLGAVGFVLMPFAAAEVQTTFHRVRTLLAQRAAKLLPTAS